MAISVKYIAKMYGYFDAHRCTLRVKQPPLESREDIVLVEVCCRSAVEIVTLSGTLATSNLTKPSSRQRTSCRFVCMVVPPIYRTRIATHALRLKAALSEGNRDLLNRLKSEIEKQLPDLKYEQSSSDTDSCIIIKPVSSEISNVLIYDDKDELTVYVGNFTHWHATGSTNEVADKELEIVSDVIEFLADLINDKIVLWGNGKSYGGFYHIEHSMTEQDTPLKTEAVKKYLWSGRQLS